MIVILVIREEIEISNYIDAISDLNDITAI